MLVLRCGERGHFCARCSKGNEEQVPGKGAPSTIGNMCSLLRGQGGSFSLWSADLSKRVSNIGFNASIHNYVSCGELPRIRWMSKISKRWAIHLTTVFTLSQPLPYTGAIIAVAGGILYLVQVRRDGLEALFAEASITMWRYWWTGDGSWSGAHTAHFHDPHILAL